MFSLDKAQTKAQRTKVKRNTNATACTAVPAYVVLTGRIREQEKRQTEMSWRCQDESRVFVFSACKYLLSFFVLMGGCFDAVA